MAGGGYALWFIPVLLGTELWYYVICKLSRNRVIYINVLLILSTTLGYITYYFDVPNNYDWCLILTAVLFYGIGNIMKDTIISYYKNSSTIKVILTAIVLFILTCSYKLNPSLPEFATNNIVGPITYIAGISGGLMMCCIAAILSRLLWLPIVSIKRIIVFIGKNSFIVLAFHQIILLLLGSYTTLSGCIQRIIMWGLLGILIYVISNYFPALLGRTIRIGTFNESK